MRIGILGGTFNPVHIGHLILAEEVREKVRLDKVIFVPTHLPPHKDNLGLADAACRYQMLKLAVRGNRFFSVSDIEIKRPGRSYTIDTVKQLKRIYHKDTLFFITGSDLLKYLGEWKDLKEILKLVRFVVATRPGYPLNDLPAYISRLDIRPVDISGFQVRQCVKENKSFRYLVPESVYRYILRNRLYSWRRRIK